MKLLSIIIPVKDDINNLIVTTANLYENEEVEVIVIDGNSTDGSYEYALDKFANVIKQKDQGIYQAFNEGLQLCTARNVLYLCCGDVLYVETILQKLKDCDSNIYAFSAKQKNEKGSWHIHKRSKMKPISNTNMSIIHGSLVINKKCYVEAGGFNIKYKISADVAVVHKIIKKHKIKYFDDIVVEMIPYGMSRIKYNEKIIEHSKIMFEEGLIFRSIMYIPFRLIRDKILVKIWVLYKNAKKKYNI